MENLRSPAWNPVSVDAPRARGAIRPDSAPPPEAAATAVPEPARTTVPISARQLSSASGVPAGRTRGVSPRAVTQPVSTDSSHSRPAVPGEWVSSSLAVIAGALAVTTVRASSSAGSAGKPRRPWRDLAAQCPDGGRAMIVCWWLDQGQDQSGCVLPLAGPAVTCTGPSPHCLSSTPAPIPRWPG